MRILAAALILPILSACTPDAPIAVAAPEPAPVPIPAGCTVDPSTRVALGAMTLDDAVAGASGFGLPASDVLRLWRIRDGNATPGDIEYARGCLGINLPV